MKKIGVFWGIIFFCLLTYMALIKIDSMDYSDGGTPLTVRWEGMYHDYNFRDIGSSVNECLGENFFRADVVFRAAMWFSGWSCDGVGKPDVIYSLNYSPKKKERYYCRTERGKKIGRYYNPDFQLSDLEFIETWADEKTSRASCVFLKNIFASIIEKKKALIHCSAGRDRTGTFSAILIAMTAEKHKTLNNKMYNAIECDYRKTKSLVKKKFGRMKHFIQTLRKQGGIAKFLKTQCGVEETIVQQVADRMKNPNIPRHSSRLPKSAL